MDSETTFSEASYAPFNPPSLFWNYTRYSTATTMGDSDRRQLTAGRRRAEELGMTFVDSYRDLGISAFHSATRRTVRSGGSLKTCGQRLRMIPGRDPVIPFIAKISIASVEPIPKTLSSCSWSYRVGDHPHGSRSAVHERNHAPKALALAGRKS